MSLKKIQILVIGVVILSAIIFYTTALISSGSLLSIMVMLLCLLIPSGLLLWARRIDLWNRIYHQEVERMDRKIFQELRTKKTIH